MAGVYGFARSYGWMVRDVRPVAAFAGSYGFFVHVYGSALYGRLYVVLLLGSVRGFVGTVCSAVRVWHRWYGYGASLWVTPTRRRRPIRAYGANTGTAPVP